MAESPTRSPPPSPTTFTATKIPVEIISEEEMALYEAALAAAHPAVRLSTQFYRAPRSIQSITLLSKRTLSACSTPTKSSDIEDSGRIGVSDSSPRKKKNRGLDSFLHRFRRKRGLAVTDITGTEWCEKQMEFSLLIGKRETTKAMKAGIARHMELEEEVVKRVKVHVESVEDVWALKFVNFIVGANQLLFDGLTRELPLVGFVGGTWMVGVIDEIRMTVTESERYPTLVDTKTRVQAKLPSEPQRRNGRLQLMCYKYLWDGLVDDEFPIQRFFDFFPLNPRYILSSEIRDCTAKSGFPSETLNDLVRYYQNSCRLLPRAHDLLLLRYELQEDQSLLGEDQFTYDSEWLEGQIKSSLEFWQGEREASYTPTDERWKCKFCKYASACPVNVGPDASPSTPGNNTQIPSKPS